MRQLGAVSLERLEEALGNAIALGAGNWCGHGLQTQLLGKALGLGGRVAAADICQPFNGLGWLSIGPKPVLHRLHHQVAHQRSIDAFGGGHPAHDFAITTIQRKRHPNPFSVVASQLQSVRTPTRITFLNGHFAHVLPGIHWLVALPEQQQAFVAHHAIDPLVIDPMPINSQPSPHAPVAKWLRESLKAWHTALTAHPRAMQASAQSTFYFGKVHSLLENLVFQSLAAQSALRSFQARWFA